MMMLVRSCMGTPLPRVTSRNDNDNDDDAMINDNDNDNDNDDGDGDNDNATLSTQYSVLHLKQPQKKPTSAAEEPSFSSRPKYKLSHPRKFR